MLLIMLLVNKIVYSTSDGNIITDILIGTAYTYVVIGVFIYLPCILVMNMINWLNQMIIKNRWVIKRIMSAYNTNYTQ